MSARQIRKQGFTLVEILIVVVILGILAAIVIPQFTSASESAKASSLISQLQTIRSQLELYQVQHQGEYPPLVTDGDWDKLTGITDSDGNEYDSAADAIAADVTPYGPYLQKAPGNKFVAETEATAVSADGVAAGWAYDEDTGAILAVIPADKWDELYELGLGTVADEALTENSDVIQVAAP